MTLHAADQVLGGQEEVHDLFPALMVFQSLPVFIPFQNPNVILIIQSLMHEERVRARLILLDPRGKLGQTVEDVLPFSRIRPDPSIPNDPVLLQMITMLRRHLSVSVSVEGAATIFVVCESVSVEEAAAIFVVCEVETGRHRRGDLGQESPHGRGVEMRVVQVLAGPILLEGEQIRRAGRNWWHGFPGCRNSTTSSFPSRWA